MRPKTLRGTWTQEVNQQVQFCLQLVPLPGSQLWDSQICDDHPDFRPRPGTRMPAATETGPSCHLHASNRLLSRLRGLRVNHVFPSGQEVRAQDFLLSVCCPEDRHFPNLPPDAVRDTRDFQTHEKGLILTFPWTKINPFIRWPLVSTLPCWLSAGWWGHLGADETEASGRCCRSSSRRNLNGGRSFSGKTEKTVSMSGQLHVRFILFYRINELPWWLSW